MDDQELMERVESALAALLETFEPSARTEVGGTAGPARPSAAPPASRRSLLLYTG